MRPVEFYVNRVRAFPARPVLVWANSECDDGSAWWDLWVIFEKPDLGPRWPHHGFEHHDPVNGSRHIFVKEVDGRRYAELLVACPPGDIFSDEEGRVRGEYPPGHQRDVDGQDRIVSETLARQLGEALGIPHAVEPRDAPHLQWWDVWDGWRPPARTSRGSS